jgi:hypothetical protein
MRVVLDSLQLIGLLLIVAAVATALWALGPWASLLVAGVGVIVVGEIFEWSLRRRNGGK